MGQKTTEKLQHKLNKLVLISLPGGESVVANIDLTRRCTQLLYYSSVRMSVDLVRQYLISSFGDLPLIVELNVD